MIYCMSNIYGNFLSYSTLLRMINFCEDDTLYVLGDVVDYGDENMRVLLDMMKRPNVIPILGEHDFMAYHSLNWLYYGDHNDEREMEKYENWLASGGAATVFEFRELSRNDKDAALSYLGQFSLYREISVNGRDFVLIHKAPRVFSPEKPLSSYSRADLLSGNTDYEKVYFPDKYLVTGHTPTREIFAKSDGLTIDTVFVRNNHIATACGGKFDQLLSAICLDTFEDYYA